MKNEQYELSVLEAGVNTYLFGQINLDLVFKVTHLNDTDTKFGFRWGGRFPVKGMGELNLWTEKSYLPTIQSRLFKYEMYNLGLTRYFH